MDLTDLPEIETQEGGEFSTQSDELLSLFQNCSRLFRSCEQENVSLKSLSGLQIGLGNVRGSCRPHKFVLEDHQDKLCG